MGFDLGKGGGGGGGGGGQPKRRRVSVFDADSDPGNPRITGTRETDDPNVTAFDTRGGVADASGVWHYPGEEATGLHGEMGLEMFGPFLDELMASARSSREMGEELFGLTRPLRGQTVDTLSRVLRGERPETFRVFAPEREAMERQFTRAREGVLANTPARGGDLNRQLKDVEVARALGVSSQEADIRKTAFDQALATGFGQTPQTSISGVTGAGALFGSGANTALGLAGLEQGAFDSSRNRSLATLALLGQLMGGSAGRSGSSEQAKKSNLTSIVQGVAKGACWVAAALYGRGTPEWAAARRWMLAGRLRLAVYLVTGRLAAVLVRRSARVRWALRPYFDRAVWEGA